MNDADESTAPKWSSVVGELLLWALVEARKERSAIGASTSAWAALERSMWQTYVGSGNRGTKGTGTKGAVAELAHIERIAEVDRVTLQRYYDLPLELRAVADAVREDGQGDQLLPFTFAGTPDVELHLSFPQRVGRLLASADQRQRWDVKIATKERIPAMLGMETKGREALNALASRWGK